MDSLKGGQGSPLQLGIQHDIKCRSFAVPAKLPGIDNAAIFRQQELKRTIRVYFADEPFGISVYSSVISWLR